MIPLLTTPSSLNNNIKNAVSEVANLGVFYVDSWQSSFDGHRYCESSATLPDDADSSVWFFARNSPHTSNTPASTNSSNTTLVADATNLARMFHPKAEAYAAMGQANIDAITGQSSGGALSLTVHTNGNNGTSNGTSTGSGANGSYTKPSNPSATATHAASSFAAKLPCMKPILVGLWSLLLMMVMSELNLSLGVRMLRS